MIAIHPSRHIRSGFECCTLLPDGSLERNGENLPLSAPLLILPAPENSFDEQAEEEEPTEDSDSETSLMESTSPALVVFAERRVNQPESDTRINPGELFRKCWTRWGGPGAGVTNERAVITRCGVSDKRERGRLFHGQLAEHCHRAAQNLHTRGLCQRQRRYSFIRIQIRDRCAGQSQSARRCRGLAKSCLLDYTN